MSEQRVGGPGECVGGQAIPAVSGVMNTLPHESRDRPAHNECLSRKPGQLQHAREETVVPNPRCPDTQTPWGNSFTLPGVGPVTPCPRPLCPVRTPTSPQWAWEAGQPWLPDSSMSQHT